MSHNPHRAVAGLLLAVVCLMSASADAQGRQRRPQPPRTVPVFEDGQAQIVPGFADSAQWIREQLWVETTFDSDGDGQLDRMHVDVTRPLQTRTEELKVPVIYETSPYYAGTSGPRESLWNVQHEVGRSSTALGHRGTVPFESLRNVRGAHRDAADRLPA